MLTILAKYVTLRCCLVYFTQAAHEQKGALLTFDSLFVDHLHEQKGALLTFDSLFVDHLHEQKGALLTFDSLFVDHLHEQKGALLTFDSLFVDHLHEQAFLVNVPAVHPVLCCALVQQAVHKRRSSLPIPVDPSNCLQVHPSSQSWSYSQGYQLPGRQSQGMCEAHLVPLDRLVSSMLNPTPSTPSTPSPSSTQTQLINPNPKSSTQTHQPNRKLINQNPSIQT